MSAKKIIYGTAWKKERTTALVVSAVLNGFRAIDTAGQPRHYSEDLVGKALQILQDQHGIKREDLWIQTKFTPINGQDRSKPFPYDPSSTLPVQVKTSFQNSLKNLHTTYLDSYILHGPLETLARTITAWKVLIQLQESGQVRKIGVSNTYDVSVLEALESASGRRVEVVQNQWYEGNNWDADVLKYCQKHGVQYQSFWTLTGSPSLLKHPALVEWATTKGITPAQALYCLAQTQGITPISGTSNEEHMREDVSVEDFELTTEDEKVLQGITKWMGL